MSSPLPLSTRTKCGMFEGVREGDMIPRCTAQHKSLYVLPISGSEGEVTSILSWVKKGFSQEENTEYRVDQRVW